MNDLFTAIGNFGFPVVVAGYLLFRFENKIESFGQKIDRFSEVLEGKPSENKKGLINTLQENSQTTKDLTTAVNKLTKTQ